MPFKFSSLELPGLILIEPTVFPDDRGFFLETYKYSEFSQNGIPETFVQINQSHSSSGVVRGLHYQLPPRAQGKLVRCLCGLVFDVAIDIRKQSPSFGKWLGVILSAENRNMLFIPPGFAHGFYAMEEADVMYQTTDEYAPEYERGIIWNDPDIKIQWPDGEKIISEKDKDFPPLKSAEIF